MTEKDAAEILKTFRITGDKHHEALDVAIKALEQEPCDDAVSRQWLIKCMNEEWIKFDTEKDKNRFIHIVRDIAPSVTPQPKIGHWIRKDGYSDCSECGSHIVTEWDYCPKCGAKMIEPQESQVNNG